MLTEVVIEGLDDAVRQSKAALIRSLMKAMRDGGTGLKEELRDQTFGAGLGSRLAKTWQMQLFPARGGSLEPAAQVFSKAPKIIDGFIKGATIVPVNGRRYLAMPTEEVPRLSNRRAMRPGEVEKRFGRKLVPVMADKVDLPRAGPECAGYLVMNGLIARKSSGRWRNASERERAKRKSRVRSVVMFTLQRQAKLPKKLELQATARRWATSIPTLLERNWEG